MIRIHKRLNNSTVSGNQAQGIVAGAPASSGGIKNGGTLILNNSTVSHNKAIGSAGGIGNSGDLTLINSTVNANTAFNDGGGITASYQPMFSQPSGPSGRGDKNN